MGKFIIDPATSWSHSDIEPHVSLMSRGGWLGRRSPPSQDLGIRGISLLWFPREALEDQGMRSIRAEDPFPGGTERGNHACLGSLNPGSIPGLLWPESLPLCSPAPSREAIVQVNTQ